MMKHKKKVFRWDEVGQNNMSPDRGNNTTNRNCELCNYFEIDLHIIYTLICYPTVKCWAAESLNLESVTWIQEMER